MCCKRVNYCPLQKIELVLFHTHLQNYIGVQNSEVCYTGLIWHILQLWVCSINGLSHNVPCLVMPITLTPSVRQIPQCLVLQS